MPTILPPARPERILRACAYATTALIGASVLLTPPTLHSVLGTWMTVIWALFILTAVPCIPATLRARYRMEYVFLPMFTSALIVSVVVLWIHYGYGDAMPLTRLLAATALVFMFCARWANLHRIVNGGVDNKGGRIWTRHLFRRSPRSS